MTSELRPAMEVWTEAFRTWDREPGYVQAVYEAAAVIEADREAVRAPLLAEIERLTIQLEVESGPSPYCPICGSCGEDGCCGPQRCLYPTTEQAAELAKYKALAETLAGALKAYAEYCDICHGRGSIIEEDSATGADLWRDCPGCGPATEALREYKEARDA